MRLAYFDDRKSKELHDQREREVREARAIARAQREAAKETAPTVPEPEESTTKRKKMPGVGHTLTGQELEDDAELDSEGEEEEQEE